MQLAVPDGVAAQPGRPVGRGAGLGAHRPARWSWPWPSRPRPVAADPRIRQVDHADYGDGSVEVALVSTTGIRPSSRKTSGFISVGVIAGDGDASQTGGGFSVGRGLRGPGSGQGDRTTPSLRAVPAARCRPRGRRGATTVVFDRRVATTLLVGGVLGPVGGGGGQGPLVLRRPDRGAGRGHRADPGRRSHRSPCLRCRHLRRRGPGLPAQRPDRRGGVARLPLRHRLGLACRCVVDGVGGAGRVLGHTRSGMPGPHAGARAGGLRRGRRCWPRWARACSSSR